MTNKEIKDNENPFGNLDVNDFREEEPRSTTTAPPDILITKIKLDSKIIYERIFSYFNRYELFKIKSIRNHETNFYCNFYLTKIFIDASKKNKEFLNSEFYLCSADSAAWLLDLSKLLPKIELNKKEFQAKQDKEEKDGKCQKIEKIEKIQEVIQEEVKEDKEKSKNLKKKEEKEKEKIKKNNKKIRTFWESPDEKNFENEVYFNNISKVVNPTSCLINKARIHSTILKMKCFTTYNFGLNFAYAMNQNHTIFLSKSNETSKSSYRILSGHNKDIEKIIEIRTNLLASSSRDKTMKIWDTINLLNLKTYLIGEDSSIHYSKYLELYSNDFLITGLKSCEFYFLNIANGEKLKIESLSVNSTNKNIKLKFAVWHRSEAGRVYTTYNDEKIIVFKQGLSGENAEKVEKVKKEETNETEKEIEEEIIEKEKNKKKIKPSSANQPNLVLNNTSNNNNESLIPYFPSISFIPIKEFFLMEQSFGFGVITNILEINPEFLVITGKSGKTIICDSNGRTIKTFTFHPYFVFPPIYFKPHNILVSSSCHYVKIVNLEEDFKIYDFSYTSFSSKPFNYILSTGK